MVRERKFILGSARQGIRLILFGFFKKIIIADSLSIYVNEIFDNFDILNGGVLLLGLIYFSFQIYCRLQWLL